MKKILVSSVLIVLLSFPCLAQQFLDQGVIEFEVVSNVQKNLGRGNWADMLKENLPKFKTGYYTYTFAGDKSIYKFDRWGGQALPKYMTNTEEESQWFYDFENKTFSVKKIVYGSEFTMQQKMDTLEWKLTNENRVIAGFNCRKAVAQILDSVYVFAFYTDEILIPGGPCSIHGLPGMILGMTIPRLYTSWIATKVMVNNVPKSQIKAPSTKKVFTRGDIIATLQERMSDWYSDDPEENANIKDQKARMLWNAIL